MPEEIGSVFATSQASAGLDVGATKGTKAISAPSLNKNKWLENYCEMFGLKEDMNDNRQAKMINAWIKAKKAAASA